MSDQPTSRLGNRYVIHEMSRDYGERRYAIEDLALTRDNLVRHWRQRGGGRVTAQGIRPPKTGMIWRGTEDEAGRLCESLNKAAALGTLTVASDPPVRANAIARAKEQNARAARRRTPAATVPLFKRCEPCDKFVKEGHQCH